MRMPSEARHTTVPTAVAGRALGVAEVGPESSTRTVVLVSGLGGAWFDWAEVVAELPSDTRIVIPNRPGTADSPPWDAGTTDIEVAVEDLLAVFDALDIKNAVIAGHSMGAWYAEAFARLHPSRVDGLVLIDGSVAPVPRHPSETPTISSLGARSRRASFFVHVLDQIARRTVGWQRTAAFLRRSAEGALHGERDATGTLRHLNSTRYDKPTVWHAIAQEWAAYNRLRAQVARLRSDKKLPDVRTVVITAVGKIPRALSPWVRAQRKQRSELATAAQLPIGWVVVQPAPHLVILSDPRRVSSVIDRCGRA